MKIICVGRNFVAHAHELNNAVPDEPVLFMKPKNAFLPYRQPFLYPAFTNELHYECELVVKVSKNGKGIPISQAMNYVDEITVGIDFTARDVQDKLKEKRLPWEKAKSWDSSAVVGDFIPFTEEMKKNPVFFSLNLNGETVQKGDSSLMIFPMARLISNISDYFTLNIGDLIYTGTPEGVGPCVVGDQFDGFIGAQKLFSFSVK